MIRSAVSLWSCWFVGLALLPALASQARAETPNVLLLFADDQGYQDLSCFGSPHIKTPNIDRIAAEGMRFTDFYSGYCVCSASRASLMTGSYQPRISMPGVLGPHSKVALNPAEITIADLLKTKGYATQMIGKWHLGDSPETLPIAQGFDHYFGLPYSNDMARLPDWGNDAPDLDKIWQQKKWDIYQNQLYRDTEVIESPVDQTTIMDRYTDEAIQFITNSKDKPWCLYLAYHGVHVPHFVPARLWVDDPHQAYRLVMEQIDASVGRILKALDDQKLTGNTFVFYSSDNGPWLSKKHHAGSALPLRDGKTTTYEGGMREPCVMRWPGHIPAGSTCHKVAGTIDMIATLARITGATIPADRPIDGRDISGLLANPNAESPHDREGYFYYKNGKVEAIRKGAWKLRVVDGIELYNLEQDVGETANLAEKNPQVIKDLQQAIAVYDADLKAHVRPAWQSPDAKKADKQAEKKKGQGKQAAGK